MSTIGINEGSASTVPSDTIGGVKYPIFKLDYGALGASSPFSGTLPEITNLTKGTLLTLGTVGNLNNGSVNVLTGSIVGTFKLDPTSVQTSLTFGTLGTAGGSFFGTLSGASGAGTRHYISGLQVIGQSGTADVRILAGSSIQGTGVLGAGIVVPGGGFVRDFNKDFQTGTNSELIYHFVGAGTAFVTINYWKGA